MPLLFFRVTSVTKNGSMDECIPLAIYDEVKKYEADYINTAPMIR